MSRLRYKTLVDQLAQDIRSGRLAPGTRLPTHRKLAAREHLSLVTATRVYAELQAMGLVSGETGRGTFVREIALPSGHGIDQHVVAADMIDLNFNYPSLPGQTEMLRNALRQLATSGDLAALLRYAPHGGRMHEREVMAQYLDSQGLTVDAAQVLIVNGAQDGLSMTLMANLKPGDVVAVDALTYPGFRVLADVLHLELLAIPAAGQGPDITALEKLCRSRRVRAVYTMPTMHNPLGWVMSEACRRQLIAVAREHRLLIIEDAAYAYLVEDAPVPIAQLAPDITIYITGFAKNVAAGLRLGLIAAPPAHVPLLERAIRATTWSTPGVMSAIATEWIRDGTVLQLEYQKREDARLRQSMAREILSEIACVGHPASYFLWIPLGEDARADQIVMALMREQISVSTAEPFATTTHVPHAIRIALGSVAPDVLAAALKRVREYVMTLG
ncbi:aminotransferase-like domain-containing protein [Advenella mimigardefordensis]|uniref:Transcriptional regulator, GntR family n=1 Tax=Advenella mimigardefordensis (strain DSM 17166 / LMG 22922 / DPN7) TaxID=1247726 RepID=W0PLL2_ADVMD|nr:PLP-dependent aminotransferase family protein [Advenella mimigardefordensis]AHG65878.1 transcriptional regulator, GntR family [Advenella mimigardefordensis DPN7]